MWRVAVFVRTLHPNLMGRRFVWRPGAEVEVREAPFELLETSDFLDSTIARVYLTADPVRRRLAVPHPVLDFPILSELRAEGVTDYFAAPLVFTDGTIHVATWTTREPRGFTDEQIAGIEAIMTPLARVAEIRALRRMAGILLDTYVGHDAGERILAGHIRRGDIEEIHAAIWLSDMRGFTALADSMPPRVMIDLLNRYFDCQVPVILDHGAEVLKFMGDGLLAIFAIADDETEACKRALAAARQAPPTSSPELAGVCQLRAVRADKVFREVASGAKTDRAQLRRVLAELDAGRTADNDAARPNSAIDPRARSRRSPRRKPVSARSPTVGRHEDGARPVEVVAPAPCRPNVHPHRPCWCRNTSAPARRRLAQQPGFGEILNPCSRAGQPQSPERGGERAQLVGHQQFQCKALFLEKLAHRPQRRPAVSPALDQHVEHLAFVIDGTPEIHPLAGDPHHHLVQMPAVAWPRATTAQPSGDHRPELKHPTPHRFVREVEPTLGE